MSRGRRKKKRMSKYLLNYQYQMRESQRRRWGRERCRIIVCDVNVFLGRKSWCFLKNLCRVFLPVAIRTR